MAQVIELALRVAGPLFFLGLQACSVQTATAILNNQTVGGLSVLPFLSLFTNCVIWTFYGYLRSDNTVLVPNVLGMFAGLYCTAAYWVFSPKADLHLFIPSAFLLAIATVLFSQDDSGRLGSMGCALAVIVMGSPLVTLRTVIRDRSTKALPFGISVTTWCNALCWTLYGYFIVNDPMIYGPNVVGFGLASIQMACFALYGLPAPARSEDKALPV